MKQKANKVRWSSNDQIFYTVVTVFLTLIALIVLYPIIYVVSCSFSSPDSIMSGKVILWPVDFTLDGYNAVLGYKKVWIGFRNSMFYTVVGTLINMFMTIICAYPVSRKDMPGRNILMMMYSFTMIFGAGMIPNYLLVRDLKMLNTVWAILIPGAIGVYNMIIMRTYFMSSIPGELLEASKMDGCGDTKFLVSVVLPLSKPILAVVSMYYIVAHWNAYFKAFMYLSDENLYPLQIFLKEILVASKLEAAMLDDVLVTSSASTSGLQYIVKYALIVVACLPMMIIFPFVQKHFVKGVMIGAVKG
ncbi:MAG: carbohydrate ABC transporter permease [Lachnospiraceae bacterium]|nr:carbohydrate ABC transporter permease [Lachnospiraceae bacterium]